MMGFNGVMGFDLVSIILRDAKCFTPRWHGWKIWDYLRRYRDDIYLLEGILRKSKSMKNENSLYMKQIGEKVCGILRRQVLK